MPELTGAQARDLAAWDAANHDAALFRQWYDTVKDRDWRYGDGLEGYILWRIEIPR